jgi:crossover junction endodeoxyribonuclease RusA
MNIIIRLPFPLSELSPNRKNGKYWGSTIKAKKSQREDAFYATKQAANGFKPPDGYIPLSLLFLTPDARHRDLDNLLASAKSAVDGVASALGINDSRFKPILIDFARGTDKVGAMICGVNVTMTQAMEVMA